MEQFITKLIKKIIKKRNEKNNPTPNVEVGRRMQTIRVGSGADYNQINGLFSKCPFELGFYGKSNCLTSSQTCIAYDYNLSIYEDVIKNLRFFYTYLNIEGSTIHFTKNSLLIKQVCIDYMNFIKAHHTTFDDVNWSISGPYGWLKLLEQNNMIDLSIGYLNQKER